MKLIQIASWIMIFVVFALSIYAVTWIRSTSFQCVSNPYVYSIKLLEKANDGEVTAIFTTYPKFGNSASVLLTNKGFQPIETGNSGNFGNFSFNFSSIKSAK